MPRDLYSNQTHVLMFILAQHRSNGATGSNPTLVKSMKGNSPSSYCPADLTENMTNEGSRHLQKSQTSYHRRVLSGGS